MRAHAVEPTLSWPSQGSHGATRLGGTEATPSGWSSHNVARADAPLARVAALLVSISRNNSYEGRDPQVVPDTLTSGFVADLLGVDVAALASLLVDLQRRGLVENNAGSLLRLTDVDGLERLAN
jgi:hypothetical protein